MDDLRLYYHLGSGIAFSASAFTSLAPLLFWWSRVDSNHRVEYPIYSQAHSTALPRLQIFFCTTHRVSKAVRQSVNKCPSKENFNKGPGEPLIFTFSQLILTNLCCQWHNSLNRIRRRWLRFGCCTPNFPLFVILLGIEVVNLFRLL